MKTVVKKSGVHGRGVFAEENINEGDIIEECEIIFLNKKDTEMIDKTKLYDYYFGWRGGSALALGKGSLYNHSYGPNAFYKKDFNKMKIIFIALKSIREGEEIFVNYNGNPSNYKKVWFEN